MSSADEPSRARRRPPARKSLGQHFLTDPRILERIAGALELQGHETVVEIGPGRGALTEILARQAGRLVAVEYDRALAAMLRERYADRPNVSIVEADVLEISLRETAGDEFVLAGNVPYYITTPILFQALQPPMPARAVFLVQKEVADRLVAEPGSGEYGALTVNVRAIATVERLFRVSAGAFHPAPKVDSAVIRLTPSLRPLVAAAEQPMFKQLVQGAFGMRRKQMRRVVRELYSIGADAADALLASCGIDPETRPETLAPEQFAALLAAAPRGG